MATALQTALAAGSADLLTVAGEVFTFGAEQIVGVRATLKPNDPRMQGGARMRTLIVVSTADLPTSRPVASSIMVDENSVSLRVAQVDHLPSGLTEIVVSP